MILDVGTIFISVPVWRSNHNILVELLLYTLCINHYYIFLVYIIAPCILLIYTIIIYYCSISLLFIYYIFIYNSYILLVNTINIYYCYILLYIVHLCTIILYRCYLIYRSGSSDIDLKSPPLAEWEDKINVVVRYICLLHPLKTYYPPFHKQITELFKGCVIIFF